MSMNLIKLRNRTLHWFKVFNITKKLRPRGWKYFWKGISPLIANRSSKGSIRSLTSIRIDWYQRGIKV